MAPGVTALAGGMTRSQGRPAEPHRSPVWACRSRAPALAAAAARWDQHPRGPHETHTMAPVTALAGGVTRSWGRPAGPRRPPAWRAGPGLRSGRQRRARAAGLASAGNIGAGTWPG